MRRGSFGSAGALAAYIAVRVSGRQRARGGWPARRRPSWFRPALTAARRVAWAPSVPSCGDAEPGPHSTCSAAVEDIIRWCHTVFSFTGATPRLRSWQSTIWTRRKRENRTLAARPPGGRQCTVAGGRRGSPPRRGSTGPWGRAPRPPPGPGVATSLPRVDGGGWDLPRRARAVCARGPGSAGPAGAPRGCGRSLGTGALVPPVPGDCVHRRGRGARAPGRSPVLHRYLSCRAGGTVSRRGTAGEDGDG